VPWSRVLAFDDPLHYQAAIRGADWEVYPTKRGKFRAELTQITMNQLWMQSFHCELPQIQTGAVAPNRKVIGFLTEARQPAIYYRGHELSPHDIVVNTDAMHVRWVGDCRSGGMSLPQEDFDAACQAITGSQFALPSLESVVRPSSDLMMRLVNLHKTIATIATTTPNSSSYPKWFGLSNRSRST
jgi:hypothetical protein